MMKKLTPMQFLWTMLDIPDHVIVIEVFKNFKKDSAHFAAYMQQDSDDEFTITFDRKIVSDPDPCYYVETLAHELTHVAQYASGKMVDSVGNLVYWKGIAIDESKIDYWLRPWEIEARKMQEELTLAWLEYQKEHN